MRLLGISISTIVAHPVAMIPVAIGLYTAWDRWQIRRIVREIERNRARRAGGCSPS